MDFEQQNNLKEPESQQPAANKAYAPYQPPPDARRGTGWKIFFGIIFALSVIANMVLFLMVIGLVALLGTVQKAALTEDVLRSGPRANRIAVLSVEGVIDDEQAANFLEQLKMVKRDGRVKGVIVKINSPGGTISGSDQMYEAIRRFREEEKRPVIAFMQGVAASGGYYTSVACEQIIAEPTVITGSIGVIFGHFVLEQLLKEKLGIQPVIIASGEKKGWPNSFTPFTDEQGEYIKNKLITPFYERFVQIVAKGRPSLTIDQVRTLADGSIYGAQEALDVKLIDRIGYLDDAIEQVKSMAGIDKAVVVQYRRHFSLSRFLSSRSRSILDISTSKIYELSIPQLMYLMK